MLFYNLYCWLGNDYPSIYIKALSRYARSGGYIHPGSSHPAISLLTQLPPLLPQPNPLPINLQKDNNSARRKRNSRLNPQHLRRPNLLHPRQLDIRRHEPPPNPPNGHPSADLARAAGVAVEQVRVHRRGADHDASALRGGKDGEDHVVPVVLHAEADDDEADDHEEGCGVGDCEARFGEDAPVVTRGVEVAEGVVQPVSD